MTYTAKTAKELREQAGSLLSKIASELGLIQVELASIIAGDGLACGSQVVADGGTIPHGLDGTPTVVLLTGTAPTGDTFTWTADATNITVAIKTALMEPGATQNVSWMAKL